MKNSKNYKKKLKIIKKYENSEEIMKNMKNYENKLKSAINFL